MKKILHVVNISFVIPYFLGEQFLYFKEKGYEEYVICSPSKELEELSQIYNFNFREVEILRKISILKDIRAVFQTANYIKKKQIDIAVGHTPKGALVAMVAACLMKVPTRIYIRHGLVYETSKGFKRKLLVSMERLAALLATKVICVSPSVYKRSLEDKLNAESKQYILSRGTCNGIDIERFCREKINVDILAELKKDLGLKQSDFVIGFTGRLVRDKGIIELVQAFQKLQVRYSNLILLLVGMLEERDALPDDIVDCIIHNDNIVNTGYVRNSEIEYYYALMDLFVLPSYREGFPTSVLEASAMQIPIITTKVTGCVDSIIENETGVFAEHNSNDLMEKIETLYREQDQRFCLGMNGRKFVVDNFEQHVIWRNIEKLYQ